MFTENLCEIEMETHKMDAFPERAPWHLSEKRKKTEIDDLIELFPFPVYMAGSVRKIFAETKYLKGHDWAVLLSSIGSYLIGDGLDPEYRQWFQKMFNWIERFSSVSHTLPALITLESDIHALLAEMECLFPRYMNTINFHVLHYAAQHIREVGAIPFNWSYAQERFYGSLLRLKKVFSLTSVISVNSVIFVIYVFSYVS